MKKEKEMEIAIEKEPYSTMSYYSGEVMQNGKVKADFTIEMGTYDGLEDSLVVEIVEVYGKENFDEMELKEKIIHKFNEIRTE